MIGLMLYFRPLWGEVCVKIDLSKIEGEPESFSESIAIGEDELDPSRVAGPMQVRIEGTVRPAGDRYLVAGSLEAVGTLSCGRCLEPVDWTTKSSFDFQGALADTAPLDPEIALDDGDLDVVYFDSPELDLKGLAVEQIELELPIRIVCREDCAGLCPGCGANRNIKDSCRCEPEVDSRWDALKDLAGGQPAD